MTFLHAIVDLPNGIINMFSKNVKRFITALFLSCILVLSIVTKVSVTTVITIILLSILIYVIMNNIGGADYQNSLPFSTYPNPPHLGLDGVSIENRAPIHL